MKKDKREKRKGQKVRIRYLPFKESTCQVDRDEDHCHSSVFELGGSSNRDGSDCGLLTARRGKSCQPGTDCRSKLTFLGQGSHREIRSSGLVYRAKPWVVKSDYPSRFSAQSLYL